MFKKILSSIGVGSSRVNLVLTENQYRAGERITGQLLVSGGISDQSIKQVYVDLIAKSKHEDTAVTQVLDHEIIAEELFISAGQPESKMVVVYNLPENIPVTTRHTSLYLVTGLDIENAVDPTDHDPIRVLPGIRQDIIMRALEKELGFSHKAESGVYNGKYQEFEYRPTSFMRGYLDELEVIFAVYSGWVDLYMEIDRKARGLGGLLLEGFEMDETKTSLRMYNEQITSPGEVAGYLKNFIEKKY